MEGCQLADVLKIFIREGDDSNLALNGLHEDPGNITFFQFASESV